MAAHGGEVNPMATVLLWPQLLLGPPAPPQGEAGRQAEARVEPQLRVFCAGEGDGREEAPRLEKHRRDGTVVDPTLVPGMLQRIQSHARPSAVPAWKTACE